MNATVVNWQSIGRLACELQCPVDSVKTIAEDIGIEPSAILNGVIHFSADDARQIAERLYAMRRGESC